jgi:hypothetical protein
MFQTERLQQIIDQLRNAEGMGYFDTLKLVLQLIGIFIGPVLILAVLIFIWIKLPRFLSVKMTRTEDIPVEIGIKQNPKKKSWKIKYVCWYDDAFKKRLDKRQTIETAAEWILAIPVCLMLSPLLFVTEGLLILIVLIYCAILLYLLVATSLEVWGDVLDEEPDRLKRLEKKAFDVLGTINRDKETRVSSTYVLSRIQAELSSECVVINKEE